MKLLKTISVSDLRNYPAKSFEKLREAGTLLIVRWNETIGVIMTPEKYEELTKEDK